jgi:hypothetical protein
MKTRRLVFLCLLVSSLVAMSAWLGDGPIGQF